jgi:hypothetical protein
MVAISVTSVLSCSKIGHFCSSLASLRQTLLIGFGFRATSPGVGAASVTSCFKSGTDSGEEYCSGQFVLLHEDVDQLVLRRSAIVEAHFLQAILGAINEAKHQFRIQ